MSLRSGRLHVSEQRDHLHHLHTQAITVGAKGCVDSSAPYSLKTRGSRRDGKAILSAAAAATVIQQENTRLGSKLASIYLRDPRRQTAHMLDPDLDRRRRHTAVCYDAKRAAALSRTFEENKYIASRLAAAPPSVGAIEAELRYDSVLAPRRLIRSRFKTKEDYQQYLAHRARTQATLLRHKEIKDSQAGRRSLNWQEFESQMRIKSAEGQQQQQTMRLMASTGNGSRSASVSPSRRYLQRAQSAGDISRAIMPSDLFISKLASDSDAEAEAEAERSNPHSPRGSDGASEDPYGEESFHEYHDSQGPEEAKEQQMDRQHEREKKQEAKAAAAAASTANRSRTPSRERPFRSRSAGLVRLPNGEIARAPSRSQHPPGWDSVHYVDTTPVKPASPSAGKRGSSALRPLSSKSLAVMHASPSTDSLHYAHHAPVHGSSSSDLFYSGSLGGSALMSSESTAQLMRDGEQVERALAARKKMAKSASAAALNDGPAKYRPNTAAHYSRPHPRPSAPASSKARPLSAVHSFTGLHTHDLRGARSTASLSDFFASQNPGASGDGGSSTQWEYGGGLAATLPGSDPEVARELQAILTAQRLAEAMIEKEQGRAPPPSMIPPQQQHSQPQVQHQQQQRARANPSPTRSSDTSLRPRAVAASSSSAAARRAAPKFSSSHPKQSRAAHSAQVIAARNKVLEAARGGIPTISSTLQYDESNDSFIFPAASGSAAAAKATPQQRRAAAPPALMSLDESGDDTDLDPEIAPPARPWSSPSSVPKLTIQQALARELEAVDDGQVPHAAAPNPEDEDDPDAQQEKGEEEKGRGKLDWQEAIEEVHAAAAADADAAEPTPKPAKHKSKQPTPSRQQLQQQAAEDAAAWRQQQQQQHEQFEAETKDAPPLLNHSATAGSLLLFDDATASGQPQRASSLSRTAARSASAKSLRPSPNPAAAAVDASLDPLPDDVRLSTSMSVRDLKLLLGQPLDKGHTTGAKASFGATMPLAMQKPTKPKPVRPSSSILRASPSPISANASAATLQVYHTTSPTKSQTQSRVGWQD